MSGAPSRIIALTALLALSPLAFVGGCKGGAFGSGSNNAAGSSAGGSATAGTSGSSGSGVRCVGPEDCDDQDNCTSDACSATGSCVATPKCGGLQKCCEGDCAGCCDDSDCDDGVGCTTNTCFAGHCMFPPDDSACGQNEYCSVTESCKAKVACEGSGEVRTCMDSSPCTSDVCMDGFCRNEFCATGVCCATGCAECCEDAQCDKDTDPCRVGSCQDGRCSQRDLCGSADKCCPSPDGTSASCGSCCSAAECDDGIACTDDSCSGAPLSCKHNPNSAHCKPGEVCSALGGCQQQVECDGPEDCNQEPCGRCERGSCNYDCPLGEGCCPASNACAACCGDNFCDDGIACTIDDCTSTGCSHKPDDSLCGGGRCQPQLGCVQCLEVADCPIDDPCIDYTCSNNACLGTSHCECQTAYDCQILVAAIVTPPGGIGFCPSCVDGVCKNVKCSGTCCPSGCSFDLCTE